MRIVGNNPQLSRQTQGTASGAITGGKPVIVNTDGTVTEISATAVAVAASVGSATAFEAAQVGVMDAVFDPDQNKVVIVYPDVGNSGYGTAIVGTISGTSISFGSPTVFESANTASTSKSVCYDTSNNKVVIVYRDNGNSGYLTARVGTVSGTGISFGTVSVIRSTQAFYTSCAYHAQENKIAAVYQDASNSHYGYIISFPVSGTGIGTIGNYAVFSDNNSVNALWHPSALVYDSNAEDLVVVYLDTANSNRLTAKVCRINGTNWTFGSAAIVDSGTSGEWSTVFDSNSNKIVVVYRDQNNNNYGTAKVGTVSGTSISFGSGTVFAVHDTPNFQRIAFDSNVNKVIIPYRATSKGRINTGTVSGTGISFDGEIIYNNNNSAYGVAVFDSGTNKTAIMYMDQGISNHGYASVFSHASTTTNLSASTSESFIGFAEDTVATGQPVTINTKGAIDDNMPQLESASSSLGSEVVYASATARYSNATFDSSNNRVVIAYSDGSNSSYGTAVVGSVSGTSMSFGTPVVFESSSLVNILYNPYITFDSNSNKAVILYVDGNNSNYPTAIVGTVDPSDNSISYGTPATLQTSGAANTDMSIAFDSNSNKVLAIYGDGGNSNYVTAIVGTVSGTDISFGTKAVVYSGSGGYNSVSFDSNSNKFAVFYYDASNAYGKCRVATISGTDVTFGTEATYASASSKYPKSTFDSSNNKIVVAFEDDDNSDYATAVVGTISGTDITFGTEAVINQGNIQLIANHSITFATGINKIIHFTRDGTDGDHGKVHIGTVSGTGISFGSTILVNGGDALSGVTVTFDSNSKKAVLGFMDEGNSNYGTAVVLTPAGTLEDLTPAQTYFVQTDGTLSETADDPSVTAGTAVAGSTLIVKG